MLRTNFERKLRHDSSAQVWVNVHTPSSQLTMNNAVISDLEKLISHEVSFAFSSISSPIGDSVKTDHAIDFKSWNGPAPLSRIAQKHPSTVQPTYHL